MLTLRPYQQKAIRDLFEFWESDKGNNAVVVMPTGSGKSLLIADFCRQVGLENPLVRILIVTHSRELVWQNEKELKLYWPEAITGIYSAGLKSRDTDKPILFCGIQSVYNKAFEFGKIDIVVIDECHAISRKAGSRYQQFFKDLRIANPNVVIWGCTATPFRLESGLIHEGKDAIFDEIVHVTEIKNLIKDGFLVPLISKGGMRSIDLTNVKIKAGEYDAKDLAYAADDPILVKLAVEEIVTCGEKRKSWIIFAAGVAHAEHIVSALQWRGIDCHLITGETPLDERDRVISKFRAGKLRCIVNIGVLTTGFNAPCTDLIALLFSTLSTGKYIQVCGRGMRTHTGKRDCLLLDFGGNILKHGLIDELDPVRKKDILCMPMATPPMKQCERCNAIVHPRVLICPVCEQAFPVISPHGTTAYEGPVLSTQVLPFIVEVKDQWISRHKKQGGKDSVKVAFYDSIEKEYALWLALDHGGYASEKARALVKQFGGSATSVDMALKEQFTWKKATHIRVRKEGKFFRIDGFVFAPRVLQQTIHTQQQSIGDGVPIDDQFWNEKIRRKA